MNTIIKGYLKYDDHLVEQIDSIKFNITLSDLDEIILILNKYKSSIITKSKITVFNDLILYLHTIRSNHNIYIDVYDYLLIFSALTESQDLNFKDFKHKDISKLINTLYTLEKSTIKLNDIQVFNDNIFK